ncbi:hypothetical protein ACFXA2_10110 [Micromonospora chalcea]
MSGGPGAGGRRRRKQVSVEERAAAAEDYRKAVDLLQYTAYRNLRHAIAYATVFVAVIATWMLSIGQATPATLPWYAVSILGGAFGAVTYFVREPQPRSYVLAVAVALTVVGVTGMFLTDQGRL